MCRRTASAPARAAHRSPSHAPKSGRGRPPTAPAWRQGRRAGEASGAPNRRRRPRRRHHRRRRRRRRPPWWWRSPGFGGPLGRVGALEHPRAVLRVVDEFLRVLELRRLLLEDGTDRGAQLRAEGAEEGAPPAPAPPLPPPAPPRPPSAAAANAAEAAAPPPPPPPPGAGVGSEAQRASAASTAPTAPGPPMLFSGCGRGIEADGSSLTSGVGAAGCCR